MHIVDLELGRRGIKEVKTLIDIIDGGVAWGPNRTAYKIQGG